MELSFFFVVFCFRKPGNKSGGGSANGGQQRAVAYCSWESLSGLELRTGKWGFQSQSLPLSPMGQCQKPQGVGNRVLREQVTLHPAPPDLSIPIVYPEWDRRGIEQQ